MSRKMRQKYKRRLKVRIAKAQSGYAAARDKWHDRVAQRLLEDTRTPKEEEQATAIQEAPSIFSLFNARSSAGIFAMCAIGVVWYSLLGKIGGYPIVQTIAIFATASLFGLLTEKVIGISWDICFEKEWFARTYFYKINTWIEKDYDRFEDRVKKMHVLDFEFVLLVTFLFPIYMVVTSLLFLVMFTAIVFDFFRWVFIGLVNFGMRLAVDPLIAWLNFSFIFFVAVYILAFFEKDFGIFIPVAILGGGILGFAFYVLKVFRNKRYKTPYFKF